MTSDMAEVKIEDAGGDTISFLELGGRLYPRFPPEALQGISDFPIRDDDILVCAYPKSGTHWVWEMVRMLQAGTVDVPVVEKDEGMIELFPPDKFAALPSPRALNTHIWPRGLPRQFWQRRPKTVLVIRNPKDVFVSYYNHHRQLAEYYEYSGTWRNYLPLVLSGRVDYGSWFDYHLEWDRRMTEGSVPPLLTLYFEDVKQDPLAQTKKLSDFLGCDYEDSFLRRVCDTCSFDSMRRRKGHLEPGADGLPVMYRKGQVGDWRNWFTVAQNEAFDAVYGEKMAGSSFSVRFD